MRRKRSAEIADCGSNFKIARQNRGVRGATFLINAQSNVRRDHPQRTFTLKGQGVVSKTDVAREVVFFWHF